MNLNPFVFPYKNYPNSKLATMVSKFCGAMQRMFFIFAIIITVVAFTVVNPGEALMTAAIFFLIWFLLKRFKDRWTDKIAAKQEEVDNQEN